MPAGLVLTEDLMLDEVLDLSSGGFDPKLEAVEGVTEELVESLAVIEAVEGLFPPELLELAAVLVRFMLAAPPGYAQTHVGSHAGQFPARLILGSNPGTLTAKLPMPLEATGEPENSLDVSFNVIDTVYAPLIVSFAILQGIVGNSPSVKGADSPDQLTVSFNVLEAGNGLVVSFDVVVGALTVARSGDVQMPTAQVVVSL